MDFEGKCVSKADVFTQKGLDCLTCFSYCRLHLETAATLNLIQWDSVSLESECDATVVFWWEKRNEDEDF